jgi:Ca2+-binding EF-hand superfamily protein
MHEYGEKLSDEELKLMFEETDMNKDGKVDFEDFVLMMMAK